MYHEESVWSHSLSTLQIYNTEITFCASYDSANPVKITLFFGLHDIHLVAGLNK